MYKPVKNEELDNEGTDNDGNSNTTNDTSTSSHATGGPRSSEIRDMEVEGTFTYVNPIYEHDTSKTWTTKIARIHFQLKYWWEVIKMDLLSRWNGTLSGGRSYQWTERRKKGNLLQNIVCAKLKNADEKNLWLASL